MTYWTSPVPQMVKASAYNAGDPGLIPGSGRFPLEKEMATHSSTLAWKIPGTEEPGRLQSMGSQRVRHEWATSLSLSLSWPIDKDFPACWHHCGSALWFCWCSVSMTFSGKCLWEFSPRVFFFDVWWVLTSGWSFLYIHYIHRVFSPVWILWYFVRGDFS